MKKTWKPKESILIFEKMDILQLTVCNLYEQMKFKIFSLFARTCEYKIGY